MGGCCSIEKIDEGDLEEEDAGVQFREDGRRVRFEGSCTVASMFTQQGRKGVNQDAMTLWEDFTVDKGNLFCGVFDGHGPFGHKVARYVREELPSKLCSNWEQLPVGGDDDVDVDEDSYDEDDGGGNGDDFPPSFPSWKASFVKAFKEMDRELSQHPTIDCFCSGTTSVSIVKQGEHLIIANLGDSRAILCTRDDKNQPIPVQLTVDLKPNLPSEVERITRCNGRVFAFEEEPDVHRLWLPNEDCPGLAMARAFGDFCLKDYGLISIPRVSYRRITDKDEFVVLATDGVWDVLTNKEVVKIVSSSRNRSTAAKLLVDRAVRSWKCKYPTSKIDDCAAICLFLKCVRNPTLDPPENGHKSSFSDGNDGSRTTELSMVSAAKDEDWSALEGVSRVNSLVKLPRFLSRRWRASMDEDKQV